MAPGTPQTQWQVDANNAVGHGDRIRCINTGLGSKSQQHQDGRIRDTTREVTPHQLPRVTGSISGPQDFCYQHTQGNSPEIRQCDSHCLPQQNGGTHSETLCNLAVHIWKWCLERNIFIHAEHFPRKLNVRADWHSRHTQDCSNWQLNPLIFQQLQDRLGPFSIDLFASCTNALLSTYCSWKLDPSAIAVDALSISWRDQHKYLFPPFSLLSRCLEKINREKVEAVIIAPVWCNHVWYPLLLQSLQDAPILLPNTMEIILIPVLSESHTHLFRKDIYH